MFFIGHLWIPEFRTVSKYANFGNIQPIWEQIFPIEIEYFFEIFLSILFQIRIVSNRTTSISVEVYEYCRYLSTVALKMLVKMTHCVRNWQLIYPNNSQIIGKQRPRIELVHALLQLAKAISPTSTFERKRSKPSIHH